MKKWHWAALGALTVISLIAEFTMLRGHGEHWWNAIPAFYIIWGFAGCVGIIFFSKWLGYLLLYRDENYYDR